MHEIVMREHDDFQPRTTVRDGMPDSGSHTSVLLREDGGLLRVHPTTTPFGMPRRWRRPSAIRLAPGEWVRWQINYRFSGMQDWSYRLDTINVAYGTAPADLFLGRPTRRVSELAALR